MLASGHGYEVLAQEVQPAVDDLQVINVRARPFVSDAVSLFTRLAHLRCGTYRIERYVQVLSSVEGAGATWRREVGVAWMQNLLADMDYKYGERRPIT